MPKTHRIGIVGVSGYTGIELLRILNGHPNLDLRLAAAGSSAGQTLRESWPGLCGLTTRTIEPLDVDQLAARCDAVFLALPHGIAGELVPRLLDRGLVVVDLGADFRLQDPAQYQRYYGLAHPCPERLETAVYGLVEKNREALVGARLIANPGCYPTATALASLPLVEAGLVDRVVASCVSGVSGAGRKPGPRALYSEVNEAVSAYGIAGSHRHTPEIEQTLGVPVIFTPHLVPMTRGMLATVIAVPTRPTHQDELRALYRRRYAEEPMVVYRDQPPSTADTRATNRAHVHVSFDPDRQAITALCAIDNLVKGAAGQAVQALNVALGLDERAGLPVFPVLP